MNKPDQEIRDGKFFAVISYIFFFCIMALLFKKENRFALYHAKQGLVLFVFEVCGFILSIIPAFAWLTRTAGFTLAIVVSAWGIIKALRGDYCRIILISKIAENIVI